MNEDLVGSFDGGDDHEEKMRKPLSLPVYMSSSPSRSRAPGGIRRKKPRLPRDLRPLLLLVLGVLTPLLSAAALSLTPLVSSRTQQRSSRLCLSSSKTTTNYSNSNSNIHIQVCQNKDCCQKWSATTKTPLPVILQDLLQPSPLSSSSTTTPRITFESTGCLSQCDKGPNLSIAVVGGDTSQEGFINGVSDPTQLADAVQEYVSRSSSAVEIPTTLRAAVKVMEQAQKAQDPAAQDRLLSSVIRVLVQAMDKDHGNVPLYTKSSALARAYALRAQARLDQRLADDALQDAMAALEIVPSATSTTAATQWITTRVYRTMVDAYEAKGQIPQAMDALQQWAAVDPTFSTKIAKEMARLQQSL